MGEAIEGDGATRRSENGGWGYSHTQDGCNCVCVGGGGGGSNTFACGIYSNTLYKHIASVQTIAISIF